MKIKALYVKNFKGIENLAYIPNEKILTVMGENGKGKTSFKEALYAAITGKFPDNPIMLGKSQCELLLVLDDGTEITRIVHESKGGSVLVNDKKTTAKAVAAFIEDKTGISKDVFSVISSAEKLEALTSSELGQLMLSAIPEKLDINILLKFAGVITPEVEAALRELFPPLPEQFDMAKVNTVYDLAFERRKITRKVLSQAEAKLSSFTLEKPARTSKEVEHDMHEIIRKEAGNAEKAVAIEMYNLAVHNRKKAEENIANIRKEIASISAKRPLESEKREIEQAISEKESSISSAKILIATLQDNIDVFKRTLINLGKPVCPISEKLVCTTDKTAIREELEELIASNKEGIEYQEKKIEKYNGELAILKGKKADYEKNSADYSKKILLNSQLEAAEKALPKVPEKPAELKILDYSGEKKDLENELAHVRAYEEHLKDEDSAKILRDKFAIDDAVVKLLEPKGVIVTGVMDFYLSTFSTVFNNRANELRPGFEIEFKPINGVSFTVKTDGGESKPYDILSSGEKALTIFLMIDMFNQLSQQRVLILDDIDKLDSTSVEQLLEVINKPAFQDSYDHIVLLGVNHEDTMKALSKIKADVL